MGGLDSCWCSKEILMSQSEISQGQLSSRHFSFGLFFSLLFSKCLLPVHGVRFKGRNPPFFDSMFQFGREMKLLDLIQSVGWQMYRISRRNLLPHIGNRGTVSECNRKLLSLRNEAAFVHKKMDAFVLHCQQTYCSKFSVAIKMWL